MKFDSIYIQFVDFFNKAEEKEKGTGYKLISLVVPMRLLYDLYAKFISEGIDPIENLAIDLKQKYWNIAMKYYEDVPERIKASKACYILALITSND